MKVKKGDTPEQNNQFQTEAILIAQCKTIVPMDHKKSFLHLFSIITKIYISLESNRAQEQLILVLYHQTLSHLQTYFWCICNSLPFENIVAKRELLILNNFSFCHNDSTQLKKTFLSLVEVYNNFA